MKKTLITALLVLSSVSAFAQNTDKSYKVEKVSVPSMALNIFSNLDLEAGARVGGCEITRKDYEGDIVNSKNEKLILQIQSQGKTAEIVVKKAGTISTSKDASHIILEASAQNTIAGSKTAKDLRLIIKTANYQVNVSELSIVTKKADANGVMRVVRGQSLRCANK